MARSFSLGVAGLLFSGSGMSIAHKEKALGGNSADYFCSASKTPSKKLFSVNMRITHVRAAKRIRRPASRRVETNVLEMAEFAGRIGFPGADHAAHERLAGRHLSGSRRKAARPIANAAQRLQGIAPVRERGAWAPSLSG